MTARLSSTVYGAFYRIYVHDSYVLTFGPEETSTVLWTLSRDRRLLENPKALTILPYPEGIPPVFDVSRGLVAVAKRGARPHTLHVFDFTTGNPIRTLSLYGLVDGIRMPYSSKQGRGLMGTEKDGVPCVLVVDVAGNGWIEGTAHIPPDLPTGRDGPSPQLNAVHISDDGDIVCAYTPAFHLGSMKCLTLLRWFDVPDEATLPVCRMDLPVRLEDGNHISLSCSTPLGVDAFLVCAFEIVAGFMDSSSTRQSVLRAIDTRTLGVRWEAQSLSGEVFRVHHHPDRGVVIAFGSMDAREGAGPSVPVLYIAALDANTGSLLRCERINHLAQDVDIRLCTLAGDVVVLVCENGTVSITPVNDFLTRGLARHGETEKLVVQSPLGDENIDFTLVHAAVSTSSVMIATPNTLNVISW
ncbi:hypothetical protein EXIGLDRAFT_723624 [Exidia glandulosa HHB12029]|uniref:WD40 repeat-like protein n=1 Tax=Exidia glandulosa HHB12029 TaxID=1314781 RepID=A0A165ERI3_EXIGL|nr:hypothetical protein EXIGLDRAFT_723624 [Exidia glandulosa HHB12029]